jgi:hypothetical protein
MKRISLLPAVAPILCGFTVTVCLASSDESLVDKPGRQVVTFESSAAGNSSLSGGNMSRSGDQWILATTVSAIQRQSLRSPSWYWSYGLQADYFALQNSGAFPLQRLQGYAARVSLEYFVGAEQVADLTLRPGLYFENHASPSAWDVPVDLVSGIPITKTFAGVVGFSAARFYRHVVPVAGAVWIVSPQLRLEAVYPEPAIVMKLNSHLEARLAGELLGGGFRTDADSPGKSVEFTSYRINASLNFQMGRRCILSTSCGYELFRNFAFRGGLRAEAKGAPVLKLSWEYSR